MLSFELNEVFILRLVIYDQYIVFVLIQHSFVESGFGI